MSNLDFSNSTLVFNSNYKVYNLQARTLRNFTDEQVNGANYVYSQIVNLYTTKRLPYVLRDLEAEDLTLYGFGIQTIDEDKDLVFGMVTNLEYQDYIWIDDFSSGIRIPYQYLLYIKNGNVYFFKPDNNKLYIDRFTQCYALVDENNILYRIVVINGDLYLCSESSLNLGGE